MGRVRRPRCSVFRNILEQQYDESIKYKLYRSVKGSQEWVQRLGLLKALPVHNGCVNCICWNEKGDSLLSGSDDQHLVISHAYNYKVMTKYRTSHKANIFSAKFLPCTNDTGIVSCSGDGMILYSDLMRMESTHNNIFNCHVGTTYEVATIPNDPYTFMSCGEDYTVRCFDLRTKESCIKARCIDVCSEDVIIACQRAVTALTVNAASPFQMAIGCSDSTVRLYDRRMLSPGAGDCAKPMMTYIAPGMEGRAYRITSLSFSPGGEDILVSYSSEHLYLFGVKNGETMTLSTTELIKEEPMSVDSDYPVAPVRRLRLRGDWSDTGPDARPQNYPPPVDLQGKKSNDSEAIARQRATTPSRPGIGGASQARPTLHGTLMQRMTDVLSRMLNDPATRAALSHGGEGAFPETDHQPSHSDPAPHGGSEGEEGEEEAGLSEAGDSVPAQDPLDLPLPSFSSSFSHTPPSTTPQPEVMDVELQAPQPSKESPEEVKLTDETPSTSTSSSSQAATASTSTSQKTANMSHLSELSNMYQGFIEKTGVEPMVNLMYSDVGSTASCISVFVKDDGSKGSQKPEAESSSSSSENQETLHPPPVEEHSSQPEAGNSFHDTSRTSDDDSDDSDHEIDSVIKCRMIHPIERHMEEAIENSKCGGSEDKYESCKTRKSYFKQKYIGHRNARTMIKEATFWGEDYVISGSDCGHVFMWDREFGRVCMLLEADHHVVNCVQPHPFLPLLATSGIDYDVKLWAPVHSEPNFQQDMADELMKRNAVMLEETKDTITVPASFMIRMLACLNQIRRGGRSRQQRRDSNPNSD